MSRAAQEIAQWRPAAAHVAWLGAAVLLVIIPHAARIPIWLAACAVGLVGWRVASAFGYASAPGLLVRIAVTVLAPAGVVLTHGTILGRDAGVALLVVLAGLKLVETKTARDVYVVAFLSFFLVISGFLFSQTILTGVYMLLVVGGVLAALVAANDRAASLPGRTRVRVTATLLVHSLPLVALLFILFPRLPGPLWGLPKDAHAGITKLSDSMSPGNLSDLMQSDEVAFRVTFRGPAPAQSELYWRGPVLWRSDGRRWTTIETPSFPRLPIAYEGPAVDYTVTLEPHFERWLFALEMPVTVPEGAVISADYQLLGRRPVRALKKYDVRSYPRFRIDRSGAEGRARALELPVGFHPRARALAREWRAAAGGERTADEALVERALAYFREQPFYYTLRPPRLDGDSVDEFLFVTRRGFCEYYAAAFTILMRAAGVPTRVVTGYQGGDFNPIGEYLVVRQRDAHAWAEVWIEERGWVRVDPTAAVAPDRIERGIDAALPSPSAATSLGLGPGAGVTRWLRTARHGWDAVNNAWNQWVIDYGDLRQRRLLGRLGVDDPDWRTLGLGLLAGGIALMAGLGWWLARRPRSGDPTLAAYRRLCRKLARIGLERRAHEGPADFAGRVRRVRPDLAGEFERLTDQYVRLRYRPLPPAHRARAVAGFARAVGRYRPARHARATT